MHRPWAGTIVRKHVQSGRKYRLSTRPRESSNGNGVGLFSLNRIHRYGSGHGVVRVAHLALARLTPADSYGRRHIFKIHAEWPGGKYWVLCCFGVFEITVGGAS